MESSAYLQSCQGIICYTATDKEVQDATGVARNGDAAFADYLISLGVTYRLDAPKPKGILPK